MARKVIYISFLIGCLSFQVTSANAARCCLRACADGDPNCDPTTSVCEGQVSAEEFNKICPQGKSDVTSDGDTIDVPVSVPGDIEKDSPPVENFQCDADTEMGIPADYEVPDELINLIDELYHPGGSGVNMAGSFVGGVLKCDNIMKIWKGKVLPGGGGQLPNSLAACIAYCTLMFGMPAPNNPTNPQAIQCGYECYNDQNGKKKGILDGLCKLLDGDGGSLVFRTCKYVACSGCVPADGSTKGCNKQLFETCLSLDGTTGDCILATLHKICNTLNSVR